MSIAATFGYTPPGESRRWAVSFALVLVLHVAASVLLLRWYQTKIVPSPVPPALTLIELAPLPTPPAPATPVPPPPEPQPQPQVQPQEEPTPVPKPAPKPVKPRPVARYVEPPRPQPPTVQPSIAPATPVPAQPTLSAPPRPNVDATAVPRFSELIAAQLERYKRYPTLAQRRGEQGVTLVRFTLDREGHVLNARIERSSGHTDLDTEVLALVHRAEPLPKIPADIAVNTLEIVVPVNFALR